MRKMTKAALLAIGFLALALVGGCAYRLAKHSFDESRSSPAKSQSQSTGI